MNKFKSMLSGATLMFIVALFSTFSLNGWAASPADDGGTTTKKEVWRVTGTYKSVVTGTTSEKEIVRYSDGSYAILNPYEDGYDNISFTVTDGKMSYLKGSYSGYNSEKGYIWYNVGADLDIVAYGGANSEFVGNRYKGSLWFYVLGYTVTTEEEYGGFGYDRFEWESDEKPSADDLSGMWAGKNYIYDYLARGSKLQVLETTSDITITKNNDEGTSYNIKGFYGDTGTGITATYDKAKKTITINPVSGFRSKYVLADFSSPETPIVGYMDDDQNILFTNFTLWDGDTRKTEMDSRCVLRRND